MQDDSISIHDTPLAKAAEHAIKEVEKDGFDAEVIGIEKCYLVGYDDVETPMTDVALITCLDDDKRTYKVFKRLIKKAADEFDLKKPVWAIILRLHTGLEMVADVLEHTDQLEPLFLKMKRNMGK